MQDKVWAVVPAAGVGSRMRASCPKQYLPLAGLSVIEHTLQRLLTLPVIEKIFVAISPNDAYWCDLDISKHPKILTSEGGNERADSVLNGLQSLTDIAAENDWVLVHDAARPCVSVDAIEVLLSKCHAHAVGGILGVPVADTLKRVDAKQGIEQTVDRSVLWQAQTPQLFRYKVLREALARALASGAVVTDESSAIEYAGLLPLMVEGNSDNIKITRPDDLPLAEMILKKQNSIL